MIKFLDFGKADVHLRAACLLASLDKFWQSVQGLRTKDDVHVGCAFHNGFALLARHAATHADDQVGLGLFELLARPRSEKTFPALFANRAGVNKMTSASSGRRLARAIDLSQHIGHLGRVVFVHLAPEGANVEFCCHSGVTVSGL